MKLIINGQQREFTAITTLISLLQQLQAQEPYAVALNHTFVPRAECETRLLSDGDEVEILSPIQGG